MAAAEHAFRLDRPTKGGSTRRAMLEQVERSTGRRPEGLDGPPMPEEAAHVFGWFLECSSGRAGQKAITFEGIQAFCALTGTVMWPEEVRMLKAIDVAFMKVLNEKEA